MKSDEPILGRSYEEGFICPICGRANPKIAVEDGVITLICLGCDYRVRYGENNGSR